MTESVALVLSAGFVFGCLGLGFSLSMRTVTLKLDGYHLEQLQREVCKWLESNRERKH